jgi:hypothetical protein
MVDLECENRNDSTFYEITITSKDHSFIRFHGRNQNIDTIIVIL